MRSASLQQVKPHSSLLMLDQAVARKQSAALAYRNADKANESPHWAEPVCIENQSVDLVDLLAADQRDWISRLQADWEIDVDILGLYLLLANHWAWQSAACDRE
jgi:hypothetical protein